MSDNVINPGGSGFLIEDVDAFLAAMESDGPAMVDCGGGMLIPLAELVDMPDEIEIGDQL
jgi:hypothetical protein